MGIGTQRKERKKNDNGEWESAHRGKKKKKKR